MPSKKKARGGKARRAAKSRKGREEDGAVDGIDSEMQRLQMSNNKDSSKDDEGEDAFLEAAINLAAAEKEELEAAAKNDKAINSEICNHGFFPGPGNHVCQAFIESFFNEYDACCKSNPYIDQIFEHIYEATKRKYAEVWHGPDKLQWISSHLIKHVVDMILEGNCDANVKWGAMTLSFFEQWVAEVIYQNETQASCNWNIFQGLCDWTKMSELYDGDEHTLVSFFRKRIPCKCLDNKYKEVKSIAKIGFCCYEDCSLPGNKTVRSKMLYCTQCRGVNYCSRECQAAHWPTHKKHCIATVRRLAARKSRQKK